MNDQNGPTCSICFESLDQAVYALMICSHVYHRRCITPWLGRSRICPVCRDTVTDDVLLDLGIDPATVPIATDSDDESSEDEPPVLYTPPQTFAELWNEIRPRLLSSDDTEEPYMSEDEDSYRRPFYYNTTIMEFLKKLHLNNDEYNEIINFKQRYGITSLCDAVNRVKVFLALSPEFRFTSVRDMLHKCRHEIRSTEALETIFLKLRGIRTETLFRSTDRRRKGTVFDFFDVPEPVTYSRSAMLLNKKFQETILNLFGVQIPLGRLDRELMDFYQQHPDNLHNILLFAKFRQDEIALKRKINDLKLKNIGCKK